PRAPAVAADGADPAPPRPRAPAAGRAAQRRRAGWVWPAAEAAGALLRIDRQIVLLPGADAEAAALLANLEQPFTASQARRALDTTRRVVIPLLEYLDRHGRTERLDGTLRRCRDTR
ncbi:SelB C-terminal domain-containing protein, partial [Streptomyces seoulensis]|uniref:SelB domain-containing protein n=1 Tax=Streptomyces seoulensis TaxID=73044 RepID=UPI0033A69A50